MASSLGVTTVRCLPLVTLHPWLLKIKGTARRTPTVLPRFWKYRRSARPLGRWAAGPLGRFRGRAIPIAAVASNGWQVASTLGLMGYFGVPNGPSTAETRVIFAVMGRASWPGGIAGPGSTRLGERGLKRLGASGFGGPSAGGSKRSGGT